jgi:SAM-dependent methyltransferase
MTAILEERERIIDAYGRRPVDDRRYDPRRTDQVMIAAARALGWGAYLLRNHHELGHVVEIGCGAGGPTRWALEAGASSVAAVDLQPTRVIAGRAINSRPCYAVADGQMLPFRSGSVDTVLCSTLFSSVLDDSAATRIAAQIDDVLAPGGVVLWFDFFRDNPRNPDVRGVRTTGIERLFPGYAVDVRRVVLAPPIARRLLNHPRVAAALEQLRPLRTHLVGGIRRG